MWQATYNVDFCPHYTRSKAQWVIAPGPYSGGNGIYFDLLKFSQVEKETHDKNNKEPRSTVTMNR